MLKRIALISVLSLSSLWGSDLPPEVRAKVVRILATSVGSPAKVACREPALLAELEKAGFANDPGASVAYAASDDEVRSLRRPGRLVICGKVSMLSAGAGVAASTIRSRLNASIRATRSCTKDRGRPVSMRWQRLSRPGGFSRSAAPR